MDLVSVIVELFKRTKEAPLLSALVLAAVVFLVVFVWFLGMPQPTTGEIFKWS